TAFEPLKTYFRLLLRWNRTINLTALPLDGPTASTVDRLFIEPLLAAQLMPDLPNRAWLDLGSGGGSPAIPLFLARSELQLVMVEAKERKTAFLREAVRTLGLNARVQCARFEDLADEFSESIGLVTVRAVRRDRRLFETVAEFLSD